MNVKVTRHYKANRFILYNSLLLSNCNAITIAIAIQTEHLDNTYFTLSIAFMKRNFENNNKTINICNKRSGFFNYHTNFFIGIHE